MRLAATPPDAGNSQDGVLRWMETYADALACGMYKVNTILWGLPARLLFAVRFLRVQCPRHPSRSSQFKMCQHYRGYVQAHCLLLQSSSTEELPVCSSGFQYLRACRVSAAQLHTPKVCWWRRRWGVREGPPGPGVGMCT